MVKIYNLINKFLFESNYSGYIFLVFLIVLFSRKFPLFESAYILVPFFMTFFILFGVRDIFKDKNIRGFVASIILFFIFSVISSIWSDFPIFTLKRSIYFLLVTLGSVFIGYYLSEKNRDTFLNAFLVLNILIVSISMFSLITNTPENAWSGGHGLGFLGYNNHQNKLGQYVYLTAAPLVLFFNNLKFKKKFNFLIYFLLFINLMLIALTVSRGAILALFIVWFLYYLISYSIVKTIIFSIVFIGMISATVFVTSNYFSKSEITLIKHEQYLGQRRSKTIQYSWEAALNGSLFGLGYGISDERFLDPLLGYYDNTKEGQIYRREKTISILALIEEVGVFGLVLFLLLLIYPLILVWSKINFRNIKFRLHQDHRITGSEFNYFVFIFAFLVSLNVYAQIESWWIGIGSAVLPVYFIFSGASLKDNLS